MTNHHGLAKIAILLFALTANTAYGAYDVAKYCQLVVPDTRFPSLDNCQTYYSCNGDGTYGEWSCPEGESFDKDYQQCKPASSVQCYYGMENVCARINGKGYVTDPKNCHGYIYCVNQKQQGKGNCPPNQIFNGKACIYGSCTNDEGSQALAEVGDLCQIMKSTAFFGDFKECNQWHQCNNGEQKNGKCDTGLVFNTRKGMCLQDDKTMCSRIPNPAFEPTTPCNATVIGLFEGDANVCSVYYKCENNGWSKKTCKEPLYYDAISHGCVSRQSARPTEGCNRCQYAATTWVNAVEYNCQKYLICNSGKTVGENSCTGDRFFNELRQICLEGDASSYRKTNGACYKVPDEEPGTGDKEPGTGDKEPGTGDKEPGTGDKEPGTGDKEPGTGDKEPGTGDKEPGTGDKEPGTGDKEPGTGDKEPGTGDKEPGTGDKEPGTGDKEPGTGDKEPGTGDKEPGTGDKEPGTGDKEPGTGDKEPGTGDKEPGTGDKEPGTGDKEPGSGDKEPGTGDKEPGTGDKTK